MAHGIDALPEQIDPSESEHLFIKVGDDKTSIIFVKPTTPVHALATRIRSLIDEGHPVITRAMGAGASHQAIKAWAIVSQRYPMSGYELFIQPFFQTVSWHGTPSSAICLQGFVIQPA